MGGGILSDKPEQHYTVPDVAKALKVDERTIRSWIESGKIRAVRIGRHYRISQSALDALLTL